MPGSLNILGVALMARGHLDDAERVFVEALSRAEKLPLGARTFVPELLTDYAELLHRTKRQVEAKAFTARAARC
jgi:hypothetical protein